MYLSILNPLDCIQCLPLQAALVEGWREVIGHVCFSVSNFKMCLRMSCSIADAESKLIFYVKSQNRWFLLSFLFGKCKMGVVCVRLRSYKMSTTVYGICLHCFTHKVVLTVSVIRCVDDRTWCWLVQLVVI